MTDKQGVRVAVEATRKRSFATAVDWPGWSRSGKTPEVAIAALLAYRGRYATAIASAAVEPPPDGDDVELLAQVDGNATTEFGVPGTISAADREPLDAAEAERRAAVVEAAWATFDRVAGGAPEELRKGPRGGGRDTAKIVSHVVASDVGYCRELGLRLPEPDPADRAAIADLRDAMLAVLRQPSDGRPIVKGWTTRYAANRIAWHALDHAWEIEDRS